MNKIKIVSKGPLLKGAFLAHRRVVMSGLHQSWTKSAKSPVFLQTLLLQDSVDYWSLSCWEISVLTILISRTIETKFYCRHAYQKHWNNDRKIHYFKIFDQLWSNQIWWNWWKRNRFYSEIHVVLLIAESLRSIFCIIFVFRESSRKMI